MYLGGIRRLDRNLVETIVEEATRQGKIMGVRMVAADGAEDDPWTLPPSRRKKEPRISGPLPQAIAVVLANQIYIKKAELSPPLVNRLIRLAAFQNPEFYRNQAMRLPVYKIPRIISCAEDIQKYIDTGGEPSFAGPDYDKWLAEQAEIVKKIQADRKEVYKSKKRKG